MLNPCNLYIPNCDGASEVPFRNLSSEAPDVPIYIGRRWDNDHIDDPIQHWVGEGCGKTCISEISQDVADLCAAELALLCAPDDTSTPPIETNGEDNPNPDPDPNPNRNNDNGTIIPPVIPGGRPGTFNNDPGENPNRPGIGDCVGGTPCDPSKPKLYRNTVQTYTVTCPDGSVFTKIAEAGKFLAETQAKADAQALAWARQEANAQKICLGDMNLKLCAWYPYSEAGRIVVTGANPPYSFDIVGELPTSMNLVPSENGTYLTLQGTPSVRGHFVFNVRATDRFGNTNERDYEVQVGGVSLEADSDLPDARLSDCYSYQFTSGSPMVDPIIWAGGGLPTGLSLDQTGKLSGTPTQSGQFTITVDVLDANGWQCSLNYFLLVRDCSSPSYTGQIGGTIEDGDPGHARAIIDLPKQVCAHVVHLWSNRLRPPDYTGDGMIQIKIYKDGAQQVVFTAASVNPFDPDLTAQSFLLPAQFAGAGDCPPSVAYTENWTAEIWGGITPGSGGISWRLIGV